MLGKLVHNSIFVIQQHSKHLIYSEDQLPATSLMMIISSNMKLRRWIIFRRKTKEKRGRGAGHKTIVCGSWNVGERFQSTNVKAESLMDGTVKRWDADQSYIPINGAVIILPCSADTEISILTTITSSNNERCTSTGSKDSGPLAKERLMKHHGISKEKFLYCIKEWNGDTKTEKKYYFSTWFISF